MSANDNVKLDNTSYLKFGSLIRGDGKIFQQVIANLPQGSRLISNAKTAGESPTPLPSLIIERDAAKTSYVLILAILSVPQDVTITVVDESNETISSYQETLSPRTTKLVGRLNTINKSRVVELRNCDREALPHSARLSVNNIINDANDQDIVWGEATFDVFTDAERQARVHMHILGSDGQEISSEPCIILRDSCDCMHEFPNVYLRTIQYSIRIPSKTESFIVWAESDSPLPDGMVCVQPDWAANLRKDWHAMTDGAMLDPDYNDWFIHNHRSNPRSISLQRTVSFDIQPTFSIVVPLYHTPLTFLDEMIQSVLSQTYSRFELILVNSTTEDLDLTLAVDKYAKSDKRIKVISLNTNLGITENTNAGIRSATGDFIAFLDHDDILEPDILYQYVVGINEYPTTDLLYCDEDKVQDGVYSAPNLKPDFDWDRLYSFNYVCHMLTVRSSVLNTLELPGSEFDGAQDYHMTLRVAEKARNIFHARKVLYHWRIHDGSVASNADAKSWTSDAGTLAIQTHFDRIGVHAHVTARDISPNTYKVNYELFDKPLISIVIPNKDASAYLKRCLDSILHGTSYDNLEIIVVENNSSEPETFEYYDQVVKDDPRVKVLRYQGEFNYSAINNWAVDQSTGEYVILLNNDIKVISPDWIEQMLGHFLEKRVGIVGAKLLFPDNTVQHAGVRMRPAGPNHIFLRYPSDMPGYLSYNLVCRQCSAVTGACLMVSREAFDDVGGLDVGFRVAFNDVDFCLRVGATGRSVVWEPDALLYHYESVSRGLDDLDNTKLLRLKKESGTLQSRWPEGFTGEDPFSSVSFDYETLYCALRK